jgi:hypothetical protein
VQAGWLFLWWLDFPSVEYCVTMASSIEASIVAKHSIPIGFVIGVVTWLPAVYTLYTYLGMRDHGQFNWGIDRCQALNSNRVRHWCGDLTSCRIYTIYLFRHELVLKSILIESAWHVCSHSNIPLMHAQSAWRVTITTTVQLYKHFPIYKRQGSQEVVE